MVRVIGVGDNTVDKYMHLGQMFPGGNAINVAVLAKRYGHQASYIGCLGNDAYGKLLLSALKAEDIDTSRCQILEDENAHCEVTLVDGDRVFGEGTHGVSSQITLGEDELAFIREHDLTHTSIYSHLENDLPRLKAASATLVFDFSQNWTREYLAAHLPHVDIAILSCPDLSLTDVEELMRWIHTHGPRLVLVTQGSLGALVFDGERFFHQGIVEANVVDTLGAGDSFAARFLVEYISGTAIDEAMSKAAQSAAETCGYYGAFGHGTIIPEID
jgi:fructoselysine 6-kinase